MAGGSLRPPGRTSGHPRIARLPTGAGRPRTRDLGGSGTTETGTEERTGTERIFESVVCGVDGSPAGAEAARQADLLMPPGGTLQLLTVVGEAELGGRWGTHYALSPGDWERRLDSALEQVGAGREVETAPVFRSGPPAAALVEELARRQATLVAVGSGEHRRLPGVVLGSVAVALLHDAPCSVLVARLEEGRPRRLRSIAVGYDGSPLAAAALETAETVARRLGAGVAVIAADGAEPPQGTGARVIEDPRPPVDALREASCDLLVVGSRGLHGVRALGSVSERVAGTSAASVLVVRR